MDIAYYQIEQSAWDAFMTIPEEGEPDPVRDYDETVARYRQNGNYVTGYWDPSIAGFVIVNAVGGRDTLESTYNYFQPVDVAGIWLWHFDGKVWVDAEYAGQHNDLLILQRDHVTYDEDGNEISRTPASFDNPNWANGWAGQIMNRFARSVSRGFNEGFQ